jgi:hypothetical protein
MAQEDRRLGYQIEKFAQGGKPPEDADFRIEFLKTRQWLVGGVVCLLVAGIASHCRLTYLHCKGETSESGGGEKSSKEDLTKWTVSNAQGSG